MEKRTSDFMSLAAIAVGGGIGLGLTGLFLVDGAAPVASADGVSVEVHVVQRARVSTASTEHFAVILTDELDYRPARTRVLRFRTDLDELERVRGNLAWGDARATFEIRELYEGALQEYRETLEGLDVLKELEGLKALDLGSLTIDILDRDEDEDKRRRRRRRRPREEAPDASGN